MKARKPVAREGSLTALLSSHVAIAESFTPSEAVLTGWYILQCEAFASYTDKLAESMAWGELNGAPYDAEFYQLDARYRWACDYYTRLRNCGHVLSCPTHGPTGASAGLSEDEALALSYRGYLGGEKLGWQAYCEACSKDLIDRNAANLEKGYTG